jgi:serine/threonine protein kinase
VVHRDLKPQNVMLDAELNVKLIDFGRAVKLESAEQRLRGSEGTYHFMAPEMLSEVFPEGYDGRQCDMWSLGVTFYCILFGILPFYEELLIKLFEKIEKCEYSLP